MWPGERSGVSRSASLICPKHGAANDCCLGDIAGVCAASRMADQRAGTARQLVDADDCRRLLVLRPEGSGATIGLPVLVIMAMLAGLGELLELILSSAGVTKAGGAKRSAGYAIVGSIAGGFLGVIIGVPVPVFGPIIGSLLFGSLGAMAGAIYGEVSSGETFSQAFEIGKAAFVGRALGTLAKMLVGLAMVGAAIVGLVV
jgi:uncharacterized protein YqgC (DUF456 family)